MIKRVLILAVACIIMTGSLIFPLSDFSLTRDLPEMYQNYSKITTPEELGVIDFIGDYLLHGRELFGHNQQDKSKSGAKEVQFQHQATSFNVVLTPVHLLQLITPVPVIVRPAISIAENTSDFKNKLFRPPLA